MGWNAELWPNGEEGSIAAFHTEGLNSKSQIRHKFTIGTSYIEVDELPCSWHINVSICKTQNKFYMSKKEKIRAWWKE